VTPEEFIGHVAGLVAGLQVPVSIGGKATVLGAGAEHWEALLHEANGGFGWTNAEECKVKFTEILEGRPGGRHATHAQGHPQGSPQAG
jgi:hypothetical protein